MPMIMLPADIEKLCRHSIKANNKHSALPIRVAIAASVLHGNEWFGIRDIQIGLAGTGKEASSVRDVAQRLEKLGIVDRRAKVSRNHFRHEARLRCDLVDIGHFHGAHSEKLRQDLEIYCHHRRRATPLAALLLLAVNFYQIQPSDAIVRFLKPEFDVGTSPTSPGRIYARLAASGLLTVVRTSPVLSLPYHVLPIT